MYGKVVFLYGIDDVDSFSAFGFDVSGITYLASHLSIERSALEYKLVHSLVLGLYGAVACELDSFQVGVVLAQELYALAVGEFNPVSGLDGSGVACPVLLLLKLDVEALKVDFVTVF